MKNRLLLSCAVVLLMLHGRYLTGEKIMAPQWFEVISTSSNNCFPQIAQMFADIKCIICVDPRDLREIKDLLRS